MSIFSIATGLVVVGAVAALLIGNADQGARNAAAQAQLARPQAIPAYAAALNAQIAADAKAAPTAASSGAKTASAPGADMRSVSVEFPSSDRAFPPGENVDVVTNNCTACHSAGMILTQPKLTAATWTAEVNKMRHTYKAPVPDEAVPQIVAYLAAMPVAE